MFAYLRNYTGEKGQGLVEYGILLAFTAAVVVAVLNSSQLEPAITGVIDRVIAFLAA